MPTSVSLKFELNHFESGAWAYCYVPGSRTGQSEPPEVEPRTETDYPEITALTFRHDFVPENGKYTNAYYHADLTIREEIVQSQPDIGDDYADFTLLAQIHERRDDAPDVIVLYAPEGDFQEETTLDWDQGRGDIVMDPRLLPDAVRDTEAVFSIAVRLTYDHERSKDENDYTDADIESTRDHWVSKLVDEDDL